MKDEDARALLRALFDAALAAAQPATCLAPYIDKLQPPKGRTVVIGAGKASAAMARAVEDRWHHPLEGLVVTRYGYGETCKRIEIVEAAHPVPDEKGRAAAGRILEKVEGAEDARRVPGVTELEITARWRDYIAAWPEGSSYLGFLFGPPFIGFIAQASSLRVSLGLIAILGSVIALFASRVK